MSDQTYSQAGEDRVVTKLFDIIGVKNQCCVDVGASDGRTLSNTYLFGLSNWHRLLIERDVAELIAGQQNRLPSDIWISSACTDIDAHLRTWSMPPDLDFASIDVDGQEYWLWHDMKDFRPRVVCIEHANPDTGEYVPERGVDNRTQAGRCALRKLAGMKRYAEFATVGVNLIFVAEEELQ